MNAYVTGQTIKSLRESKKMTQAMLAEKLSVSDKAISKWETGKGIPDITMIEPLAAALSVSVAELINGNTVNNKNKSANMLRTSFYVCPVCGNIITSTGNALISCCGVTFYPLEAEEGEYEDGISIERIENEHFVQIENPMTKEHYVSFVSYITSDRVQTVKLYPEGNASCRFPVCGRGYIFYYCNRHGLMKTKV